jgi:hypothetical protein
MIQASLRKLLQTIAIDCNCKNGQNVICGFLADDLAELPRESVIVRGFVDRDCD